MARLLVIDDEPNLQYSLVKSLSSETLEVATAGTARQGIEAVRRQPPDAVILDVRLPDQPGLAGAQVVLPQRTRLGERLDLEQHGVVVRGALDGVVVEPAAAQGDGPGHAGQPDLADERAVERVHPQHAGGVTQVVADQRPAEQVPFQQGLCGFRDDDPPLVAVGVGLAAELLYATPGADARLRAWRELGEAPLDVVAREIADAR